MISQFVPVWQVLVWCVVGVCVIVIAALPRPGVLRRRGREVTCANCGYDLRGTPNAMRCSECGRTFRANGVQTMRHKPLWVATARVLLVFIGILFTWQGFDSGGLMPAPRLSVGSLQAPMFESAGLDGLVFSYSHRHWRFERAPERQTRAVEQEIRVGVFRVSQGVIAEFTVLDDADQAPDSRVDHLASQIRMGLVAEDIELGETTAGAEISAFARGIVAGELTSGAPVQPMQPIIPGARVSTSVLELETPRSVQLLLRAAPLVLFLAVAGAILQVGVLRR